MKNICAILACGLLGLGLFTGCQTPDENTTVVTDATRVALLFSPPTKAYYELGLVSASKATDIGAASTVRIPQNPGETWQHSLQRQGASQGADAVIVNTSTINNNNAPLITGRAIRYKKAATQ